MAAPSRRRIEARLRGAAPLTAALLLGLGGSAKAGTPAPHANVAAVQDTTSQDTTVQDTLRDLRRRVRRDRFAPARAEGDTTGPAQDGLPFPAPDSVMQALMRRAGYRPVLYRGDTLQFNAVDRSIHINERALIERAGDELAADSIVYNGQTRFMTAFGRSKLVNAQGEEVTSEEGPFFYDTETRIGTVMNARTQWQVWAVSGNFTLEGSDTLWVNRGTFTSCDRPDPHYHFAADRIKMVLGHIVVAWPVRLHFGNVPVLWLPFFAQDIRRGRHSGILTPRFGLNDIVRNSTGYRRHISNLGYYWAISDYADAQLSMDWWSGRWTRLDGFLRYRWRRQFLDGRFGYSQFFLPGGDRELSLTWNHSQKFGERTDLRASVQFVSSQRFRQQNEFDPEQLVQQIRSDAGFTRRFDWGTLNLSGQRLQPLTEGRTTLSLPQASLTLNPIELTPAPSPLQAHWYHGLTWTGSARFGRQQDEAPGQPDRVSLDGSLTSGWSLGSLRLNSSASFREQVIDKPDTLITAPDTSTTNGDTIISRDTLVIGPEVKEGNIDWRSSLGYQQRLIGSTSLTPALQVSGTLFRSNETGLDYVSGPTRVSMTAGLNTDLYGFFPGFGPMQRIRHKFSPRFGWSYSPEVQPSPELQRLRGFNPATVDERHELTFTLAQTFEAKLKPRRPSSDTATAAADTAAASRDTTRSTDPTEARKITLLAIRTSSLVYDFVEGKITTNRIQNNLTSDLLRGLTIRIEHDLFREKADGGRTFDPFLSGLNLGFSIGDRGGPGFASPSRGLSRGRGLLPVSREFGEEQIVSPEGETDTGADAAAAEAQRRRPWSLSVDYSLVRIRPLPDGTPAGENRQSVRLNLGLSPTENWTINWRTQYDVEGGEFTDHVVSLRRDLHRWSATFDFLRAANGNFLFEFRVNLNDLPDLKFDYRQESEPSGIGR